MSEWSSFLEDLGRVHRAWLGTVNRAGRIDGQRAIHVNEPQAVRVEETAEGVTQALQIDDATGRRVTLRFRVAPPPSSLDGMTPDVP